MNGSTADRASRAEMLRNAEFFTRGNQESGTNKEEQAENPNEDIFDEFEKSEDIPIWEPPTPFDSIVLPKFPVDDLPLAVSDYVRAVAETTQTAIDMAAVASLAVLALSLQGKFNIEGKKDWREPLNLYTLIVAPPAERKSAVLKHMLIPVTCYESEENKRLAPLVNKNNMERNILEKRKKILEDRIAKDKAGDTGKTDIDDIVQEISDFKRVSPCKLYFDDITPQKLAGVLYENDSKAAILSAEGGIFDILAGKYSSGKVPDIDVFLKAHAGDSIRVDRIGRESTNTENPAMTTLLFVQPNVIECLMSNGTFQGRGLCARFLYSVPKSKIGEREFESNPIPEVNADIYNGLIIKLLRLKSNGEVLTLTADARELLKGFSQNIEGQLTEELHEVQAFGGKLPGAVLRIAGLLHIANNIKDSIDDNVLSVDAFSMESAINIGIYFLGHAKKAYQIMGTDENQENAQYILKKIIKNGITEATKTELRLKCRKFTANEQLDEPLNLLINHNYLKSIERPYSGTGRRPENIYLVNPQVY